MKSEADFLTVFQDIIQCDDPISLDQPLSEIQEWDSMAVMATIAYFDAMFGVTLRFEDFSDMKTVRDVAVHVPGIVL